jgi:hypothetical protein
MVHCKESFFRTFFLASSEHTKKSMANEPLSIGTIEQQYSNMDPARPLMPLWPSKMYLSSSCGDDKSAPSPLICLRKTKMRLAQLVHCSGHNQCLADACVDGVAASRHEVCGNSVIMSCHHISREILYTSNCTSSVFFHLTYDTSYYTTWMACKPKSILIKAVSAQTPIPRIR